MSVFISMLYMVDIIAQSKHGFCRAYFQRSIVAEKKGLPFSDQEQYHAPIVKVIVTYALQLLHWCKLTQLHN